MSFESGSMTFRMFYLPQPFPRDYLDRFASKVAPPISTLGPEPIHGWVTGRHLLDTHITQETAFLAGYLRLTLMRAERKIPESLLRAECRMEELARMQAEGRAEIDRRTRSEIRKEIDQIDEILIKTLAERQRLVEKGVVVKKRDGLPARDDARLRQVIDHVRVLARAHNVDPALVETMWTEMVEWFIAYEERSI